MTSLRMKKVVLIEVNSKEMGTEEEEEEKHQASQFPSVGDVVKGFQMQTSSLRISRNDLQGLLKKMTA